MSENKNVEKVAGNTFEKAELRYVDPRTVVFGPNVRTDVEKTITPDFVDSIRTLGILEPPRLLEAPDGTLFVLEGARRTLGSIAADLALYPVIVVKSNGSDLDRLEKQFHENDQRVGITDADRTAGYQEMALFGATAAQIAKRTKTTKAKVQAALGVAESQTARAVQVEHNLTIDQAAAIAEFEDDEKVVTKLTEVATTNPGQFEHEAQRQRDERKQAQELEQARKALTEAGVREIPFPGWDNKKITRVGDLADAEGNVLTVETHRACPGHAAYLNRSGGYVPVYVCTDPRANKHAKDGRVLGTPLSGQAKAERDAVLKYNPRWKSTVTVRRTWLAEFAQRSTAPKGAIEFIAMSLLEDGNDLAKAGNTGHALAAEWLGHKGGGYGGRQAIAEMVAKATKSGKPGRVQQIALVVALATIEARTNEKTWRSTSEARYFLALREFGYNLDEVEEIAAGLRAATQDDASAQAAPAITAPATPAPVKDAAPTGDTTKATAKGTNGNPVPDRTRLAPNPRKGTGMVAGSAGAKPESVKQQPAKSAAATAPKRTPQPSKI